MQQKSKTLNSFVSYELAKKLKDAGFNDECLAVYRGGDLYFDMIFGGYAKDISFSTNEMLNDAYAINERKPHYFITAPIYEQVFTWLRKEHNLFVEITWSCEGDFPNDAVWQFEIDYYGKDKDIPLTPEHDYTSDVLKNHNDCIVNAIEESLKLILI